MEKDLKENGIAARKLLSSIGKYNRALQSSGTKIIECCTVKEWNDEQYKKLLELINSIREHICNAMDKQKENYDSLKSALEEWESY